MPSAKLKPALGRNASVLLDIIRFGAAVAVLFSHLPIFSACFEHVPESLGNQAVGVFFLLSGFVIRFVTETRLSTLGAYFIDRASRIYSIVLPALAVTVMFEALAYHGWPATYLQVTHADTWNHLVPRLLGSITFTDGFWGLLETPLDNGALWSLTFEVVYYILYGLLRYTRTARWFLVPLLLLLAGPSIAGLFPVWLLGALLFDLYAWLRHRASAFPIAIGGLFTVLLLLAALRHPILHLLAATDNAARLTWAFHHTSPAIVHAVYPSGVVTWLARFSPSFYLLTIPLAALLLPLLLLLDRVLPTIPLAIEHTIRVIADSTFTLYCFHLPILVLVYSIAGGRLQSQAGSAALIAAIILFSIALAKPLDALKNRMRAVLRNRFIPRPA